MKKYFWIIPIFFYYQMAFAQNKKTMQQYHKGKTFLEEKQYTEAIMAFSPVLKPTKGNIYCKYAHYFTALAYFRLNKLRDAEKTLEKLSEKYPDWEKMEEVLYLQANIAFERKEDNIALSYIQKIKEAKLLPLTTQMKGAYLNKRDLVTLKNLQNVYPKDKMIAQILVDKLATEASNLSDLDLMEILLEKYDLEKPEKTRIKRLIKDSKRINGDTLNVAVFLPIDFKNYKGGNKTSTSHLAVEFYRGMRIAKKHLDTLDLPIRLLVYDVYKNPDTLELMYKNNEFARIDMFVGPLYDEDFEKALEIADRKDIPIINPFLTNTKFFSNKNAFFLQPTLETQARKSAEYAYEKFGKKVIIFHSDLPDDLRMMNAHKEEFERLGGKVIAQQKISVTTIPQIEMILSSPHYQDVSYVLVMTSSQAAAEALMSVMPEKLPNVPMLTTLAWRKVSDAKNEALEKQQVHFIDPDYTRLSGGKDKFKVEYNVKEDIHIYSNMKTPTISAHKGYDVMATFVKLLAENKNDFYAKITNNEDFKKTYRGYIFEPKKRDNQYIPILKYKDKKLVVSNPLYEQKLSEKK